VRIIYTCGLAITLLSLSPLGKAQQKFDFPLPTSATAGEVNTVNLTVIDTSTKSTYKAFTAKSAVVSSGDKAATAMIGSSQTTGPWTVPFTDGAATLAITFKTVGSTQVTIKDPGNSVPATTMNVTVTSNAANAAALAGCGSCFASVGAGSVLTSAQFGDYNNTANVLQSTHLGTSTPQFVVGVAYKLPWDGVLHGKLHCTSSDFTSPTSDAKAAYCFPYKAFVSLKFTPDASQTFNGFTYGVSHALHRYLDVMVGVSYSAHNEISPGFQQAAINTVKTQQAMNNTYYSQWNAAALQTDGPTAYDGFPTQLQKADGTVGPLIYAGNPLVLHYHPGLFIGVAVPLSFQKALSGASPAPSE
jgi:hypothetical protein